MSPVRIRPLGGAVGCLTMIVISVVLSVLLTVLLTLFGAGATGRVWRPGRGAPMVEALTTETSRAPIV